jgi:hypothetical protein
MTFDLLGVMAAFGKKVTHRLAVGLHSTKILLPFMRLNICSAILKEAIK